MKTLIICAVVLYVMIAGMSGCSSIPDSCCCDPCYCKNCDCYLYN